ncbi:MAG: FHA domain-containing protein [Bdellovibrionales bacterium]
MSALALSGATETKWTVISGAMSGSVRLMSTNAFSIGRSPENEFVVINDPKCSRKHAAVQWTSRGCEIAAASDANPVMVNGKEVQRAVLNDGDIVILGETKIQFNLTTGAESANSGYTSGHTQIALVEPATPIRSYAQPAAPRPRAKSSRTKKNNSGRLVFYFIIAIVGLFFMLPSSKKKTVKTLRTEQDQEADIAEANKLNEAGQNMALKKIDESLTARQAQENYVRGFRDFRKGQFERSLDSFQACLALDPAHALCTRYLRLAQRKFSEIVQYDIILGRKYREQNQYKACRASFKNVMQMVKDANSAAYKEAKANYDACNTMAEGRY